MTQDQERLYFRQVPVGPMANFVYLIGDREKGECVVVDPAWTSDALVELAGSDGMTITGMLVTHYHPDHVGGSALGFEVPGGIAELSGMLHAPIHVNEHEADGLKFVTGVSESDLVRHVSGDVVKVGDVEIELVHTPGHTPGSQCFLVGGRLVAGDTLFVGGCGRVDLPGGDAETMFRTLTTTLAKIPDDVILFPGHDYGSTPSATLGDQRKSNVYLRARSIEEWSRLRG